MRTSCIRLRPKSRIAVLYEDFLEICDGNMLAAMLLAILVYWTDTKIAKKDTNLWIWKSHQDFQEDLMFDKPGMKPPHRTTIKAALDLLKDKKFVEARKNPKMPLDQTRQYFVNQKAVQKAIDALSPIVDFPTMECRENDNATSNNQQSLSENQQCNAEKPTSNTNDYTTVITDSVTTEGTSDATSDEDRMPTRTESVTDIKQVAPDVQANLIRLQAQQQGDDDASSVALSAAAPGVQPPDSPAGIPAAVQGAGTLRRDTLPEATAVPAQATSTAKVEGPLAQQTPFSVTSPSDGAVGSAPPQSSGPRRRGQKQVTQATQLSLQGAQVKEWMESIKGRKRRMTEKNILAWNALAEEEDISFENLRDAIAKLEAIKWVQEHDYVIDEYVLSQEDGNFTFSKGMELVRRKRPGKKTSTPAEDDPYSIDAMLARQRERELEEQEV